MSDPIARSRRIFQESFGRDAEHVFRAPGRVNLIGEHTDYNGGFVLPTAIDLGTFLAVRQREDQKIRVVAADFDEQRSEFEVSDEIPVCEEKPWSNYIRGVVQVLRSMSYSFSGMDMVIAGNLPKGVGLSSSASLEVVTGLALARLNDLPIPALEIARIGQQAENEYVGCNCGIMDQLISAGGQESHALLIDCRCLTSTPVPLPPDLSVVIIDSGLHRTLVNSAYNDRRRECEEAAKVLKVGQLRDATLERLEQVAEEWDPILYRRARHVISENQRTLDAVDALRAGDMQEMGRLMAASHNSLRDDFEVSLPAIDYLVEVVSDVLNGDGGARMTGGGFGGCVVALASTDRVSDIRAVVEQQYIANTGNKARVFECRPSAGASIVPH
ncbi:MAG: galactokinase [Myxococcales bacterium]|mgnify:CR=1 FL=1|nr:galactokinase [Myxococcales bacterium]